MVAERTQVRSSSPASPCRPTSLSPLFAFSNSAMAQLDGFTPPFLANLQRTERDGQLEMLAMVLGLVGAVRAAARVGRHFAEAAYHRYLATTNVEVIQEEIFAQVDWQQVQMLDSQQNSQQQISPTTPSGGNNRSVGSFSRFVEARALQFSPVHTAEPGPCDSTGTTCKCRFATQTRRRRRPQRRRRPTDKATDSRHKDFVTRTVRLHKQSEI